MKGSIVLVKRGKEEDKGGMGFEEDKGGMRKLFRPPSSPPQLKFPKKLSILPFIFLIYFEVSGGAYGAEEAVGAAGPFCAISGFLVFPFLWSIPEALIRAELATSFPGNGGYIIWAHQAFGTF
ncbi:hypothetical protein F3Y22_tig00112688pilonHSYRG00011 [Hibiscus syriacus]|uniref:Uncharacterized protein n=1 Tax=Hibiscus syriacus TaxID=106335 RepID=A0A6A2XSR3_HIBSY|nr:hypothetical protein F3Y22_tig00112688pilonHSYRG00011 [Hibiscus syriacus]